MAFVQCGCGFRKEGITFEHIGKKAKCPKCKNTVIVENNEPKIKQESVKVNSDNIHKTEEANSFVNSEIISKQDKPKSSLLDELDGEKKIDNKIQKEEKQINRIMPLIEKMAALTTEFEKRGHIVDCIRLTDYEYTSTWFIKSGFAFHGVIDYKGEVEDYGIKNYVLEYLKKKVYALKVFNAQIKNIIIFDIYEDRIQMHATKICSAEGRSEGREGTNILLTRDEPFMVKDLKYKINPDGFTDNDIDNCFKFLLDRDNYLSLSKEAEESSGESSGGCFIATTVYESYDSPELLIFRTFRDKMLDKYILGRIFIQVYYFFGPRIAGAIKHNFLVRKILKTYFFPPILHMIEKVLKLSR